MSYKYFGQTYYSIGFFMFELLSEERFLELYGGLCPILVYPVAMAMHDGRGCGSIRHFPDTPAKIVNIHNIKIFTIFALSSICAGVSGVGEMTYAPTARAIVYVCSKGRVQKKNGNLHKGGVKSVPHFFFVSSINPKMH